ncbi:uncharacterized protein LOC106653007 [Trichogramma pretiosum]|uniref:uncharacterized protein LOC106653007 n=1 Tax=Trichogramma pretiosum TaxID=7493 RepID=UPI0006C9E062|nr:uncharacterized protein LOC106653007 [Trichogramma pretiosum]
MMLMKLELLLINLNYLLTFFLTCNCELFDNETVEIFFDDQNSNSSELEFDEGSLDGVATKIEDLKAESSPDSLIVSWRVSGKNASFYRIDWYKKVSSSQQQDVPVGSANRSFVAEDPTTSYTIEDLESCTTYNVTVTPDDSLVARRDVLATTLKSQAGAPLILTVEPILYGGHSALNVSWQRPRGSGSACIDRYEVAIETLLAEGESHSDVKSTSDTSALFLQLYACASYLVSVRAIDRDGAEGLVSTIQSKPTLPRVSSAPKLINQQNLPPFTSTKSSITLQWHVQNEASNCSVQSVSTECNLSYTEGYGYEPIERGRANRSCNARLVPRLQLVVSGLSPYTRYLCWGWAHNEAGPSAAGMPVPIFTKDDASSAPAKFRLADLGTGRGFRFDWDAPEIMPGRLLQYRLRLLGEPLYPVPDHCHVDRAHLVDDLAADQTSYEWLGGDGFTNYTAWIEAKTRSGWSPRSQAIYFRSQFRGVPDRVTDLKYATRARANDSNALDTILSWHLPCSLRGPLKRFEVLVLGHRANWRNHSFANFVPVDDKDRFQKNERFSVSLGELKPQFTYSFRVSAVIEGDLKGEPAEYVTEYPSGIPPQPSEDYMKSIALDRANVRCTTSSFEILLPLFPDTNGYVQFYAILVSRLGYPYERLSRRFVATSQEPDGVWPNVSSWREAMERDFRIPYQVTEPYWTPYPNFILDYGGIKAVKYTIGDDSTCKDFSLTNKRKLFCNGPLKPDTSYEVRMMAFTNGGYADSRAFVVKTAAEMNLVLIICIVIGVLFFGIFIALWVAYKARVSRKHKDSARDDCSNTDKAMDHSNVYET